MKFSGKYLFCALLTAISLPVSCTRAENPASSGRQFSLTVSPSDAKTSIEEYTTSWSDNDALTIFHADAGAVAYSTNDRFTISSADRATGTFRGTLGTPLSEGCSYDWYAVYPYNSAYTSPSGNSCLQPIGLSNLVQYGYGDTDHLAGENYPLCGKVTAVPYGKTPSITMSAVFAVIKLVVTNNSGKDLVVTSASITSSKANLSGSCFIDFSGDAPVLTDGPEESVSKTVSLVVSGGTSLANGSSATLYLSVIPFVARGETLKLRVNDYEKDLVISDAKDIAFSAGKVKTITFNFNKAQTDRVYQHAAALSDIAPGAAVLIVGDGEKAITNCYGTSCCPAVVNFLALKSDDRFVGYVSPACLWNVSGDAASGYTFSPVGDASAWLYCNTTADRGSNDNLRVGTGERKSFQLDADTYLITGDSYKKRYLSKYNGRKWYSYINTSNNPVKMSFYVLKEDE